MDQYFHPPKGFNIDSYIPFLKYLLAAVMAIGGILIVTSIAYIAIYLIKAIFGINLIKGEHFNKAVWGLIIGLLLFGGGWLGFLKFFNTALFPTKFF